MQQMTEAAVAKERAKLYAELKQSVSDPPDGCQCR